MPELLNENLDVVAQTQGMDPVVTQLLANMGIISALDDEPNDVGGLTSAELKAKFDEAGNIIKNYINNSLIPQILAADATERSRTEAEAERRSNETLRINEELHRAEAEMERVQSEAQRVSDFSAAHGWMEQTENAAHTAQTVLAALHLRQRVRYGPAEDADLLLPGDILITSDDVPVGGGINYQDLILEAQKAAAGEDNDLADMAVLSVVNGTNWRRDADGLIWTTETVSEFCAKLTAFVGAAVAAGYVAAEDGRCVATWSQVQAWLITNTLMTPLDAENENYSWRIEPPKSKLDAAIERIAAMEAMFANAAANLVVMAEGGTYT